jgi:hypothetical protein
MQLKSSANPSTHSTNRDRAPDCKDYQSTREIKFQSPLTLWQNKADAPKRPMSTLGRPTPPNIIVHQMYS